MKSRFVDKLIKQIARKRIKEQDYYIKQAIEIIRQNAKPKEE